MNSRNNKENHGWLARINELLPAINLLHQLPPDQNVNKFHNLVKHMVTNHGEAYTIERLKAMRLVLQQFVLKQTVTPVPFAKADKDGFPKAISFLKPTVDDVYSARYSFSVMRIIESFRVKPEYSVNTILDKSTADESLIEEISEYIQNWSFLKHMPQIAPSQLVMSNRAGPNGPATITAIKDLTALRQHEPELLTHIKELLGLTVPHLNMDSYKSHEGSFQASKLVLLSDNSCKTRIVAIADWWSNTALNSLHRVFMYALRKLPSDVTYRQSDIPSLVKGLGHNLFSSDMTAFTDRFPRKLEKKLISSAYGTKIGELWEQVVSNRIYHHSKGGVRYSCGNPMGLLSSWPVSTLTHHAVKQWCAYKVGVPRYKYLILGDDTIDSSKEVYEKYIDTINRLGVSISHAKCTRSESGYAEFAKRLFTDKDEVTGLPVILLESVQSKPEQVLELVRICRERGYEDSFLGPSLDSYLQHHINGKMIADMLSLPESVLGMPPLLEVKPGSWAQKLELLGEGLENTISIARNYVFWTTTLRFNEPKSPEKVCQVPVEPNHPLVFALSDQLMEYLPETEDEFSIYNSWMAGEYRHMANVPMLDTYRYYNKGHYATKCKYDVLKATLALANGDNNIPLHKPNKMSNFELFELGFRVAQDELI